MIYAKSEGPESLREHTNSLLERMEVLKDKYGEIIVKNLQIDYEVFWRLLNIAVNYHDVGKVFTPFQNVIRQKLNENIIPTSFNNDIPHNFLSPAFIPFKELKIEKSYKKVLTQAIGYHHERECKVDIDHINNVIDKDLIMKVDILKDEMELEIKANINGKYIKDIVEKYRITCNHKDYILYVLIKGLLHRLDHSASGHIDVEDCSSQSVGILSKDYIEKGLGQKLRDVQNYCYNNKNKNLVVVASTGMGKTESALLWIDNSKAFFTLPIRVSINALFKRTTEEIGFKHTGLLHSTSLDFLEDEGFESSMDIYEQSRNLASKICFTTIDQIFKIPFKYKGYEKIYATLSYSKVIIDEIQAYSPRIAAVILKGLEMIDKIGSTFLVMTATLPGIYKEYLKEKGIEFKYATFLSSKKRHVISIHEGRLSDDLKKIIEKGERKKVLIIANTVKKADEIFERIKNYNFKNAFLLHSLFIQKDRQRLESQIKEFDKHGETGIWVTTQIVEASLDIDFDFLFTEFSSLDSLFQRMGRCYRKREFDLSEPNVHVYSGDASGIGIIYDKEIFELSLEAIQPYNFNEIDEETKVKLVDEVYSREKLKDTEFLKVFDKSIEFIENIVDFEFDRANAQQILREIENIKVIPIEVYENNLELIESYYKCINKKAKYKLFREINKLTVSIPKYKSKGIISQINEVKGVFLLNAKYDKNRGVLFNNQIDNII